MVEALWRFFLFPVQKNILNIFMPVASFNHTDNDSSIAACLSSLVTRNVPALCWCHLCRAKKKKKSQAANIRLISVFQRLHCLWVMRVWIRQSALNQIACEASSPRGRAPSVSETETSLSCFFDSSHCSLITDWQDACSTKYKRGKNVTKKHLINYIYCDKHTPVCVFVCVCG